VEQGSTAQTGAIVYPTADDGGLVIGKYRDSDDNIPFDGRIDELAIYGHALTAAKVAARAAKGPVDQRGAGFARVADGDNVPGAQADIGAYEAQTAPSADFDTDGDVDGADFLAWQRGFGTANAQAPMATATTPATPTPADLAAWQVSFGQPQPAPQAAAATSEDEVGSGQCGVSWWGLIDAALALEWLAGETDEATDDFGEQATLEAVFADQGELFFSATGPVTLSDREVDSAISSAAETEDPDQPLLAEKLLERVFG
jgi:hypothetical protein